MRRTDARIRYTQGVLKQALLSFLQEKPINKITVKEVCERAELNRATFYAHYSDCFALLESIEEDLLEAFQQSLKLVDSFDVTALIEAIYTMIEQQQEACRVLIFQNVCPNVLRRMISLARGRKHFLLETAPASHYGRGTGDALYPSVQRADARGCGGL